MPKSARLLILHGGWSGGRATLMKNGAAR